MKIEEKIKNKFLYSRSKNFFKIIYFLFQRFNLRKFKRNFTVSGIDLLLENFFNNLGIKNGVYIDVGCNHAFINNNTYLLHRNGWKGINIDLDYHFIDMFNFFRPNDFNKQIAISDKVEEVEMYFYHNKSAINTLSKEMHILRGENSKEIKRIKTNTLNNIISNSPFSNSNINFLSIDVEGYEMNVLKGFDLKRYCPEIITVEYIDRTMKKQEFYNQSINNIVNSNLCFYLKNNNYDLVNIIDSDLVFVNKKLN